MEKCRVIFELDEDAFNGLSSILGLSKGDRKLCWDNICSQDLVVDSCIVEKLGLSELQLKTMVASLALAFAKQKFDEKSSMSYGKDCY
jgi:hypothetical protein